MKKLILFLTILISLNSCNSDKKCTDFKTGTFKYTHPDFSEWKITRTDSTQTEISSKSGVKIYSSIEWQTPCNYILTYQKIENSKPTENLIGSQIQVEIIETKRNKYTCHSKSTKFDLELEMKRID